MVIYALEDVDDALDATRALLTPLDRDVWAKLALVMVFVGGSSVGLTNFQYSTSPVTPGTTPFTNLPSLGPRSWLLVAAVVVVVVLLVLAYALVSSVMEFVFVESLRAEEVAIGRYWNRRWRQGLRLFGFRIVLGVFTVGGALVLLAPVILAATGTNVSGGASLAVLLALAPLFVLLVAVAGVINGFTTVFVVPVMILDDCGVLAGWRRLWTSLVSNWKQYLAYLVGGFVLSVVGAIVAGVVTLVLALVLLIPFGLLFALGIGLYAVTAPLGIAVMVVVGLGFLVALIAAAALVQVPVQTYLRYYALLVLGDVDADLDLIAERREAIREGEATGDAA